MDFNEFSHRVSKIKDLPLTGAASHYKMAPANRVVNYSEGEIEKRNPRQAAVMALFYPNENNKTTLLLMLRKTYQGIHSNQISFPGGKVEVADVNLLATALRETYEEVGVDVTKIEVLKTLTEVYIPPSNFKVQPYVGLYTKQKPFTIQPEEVEALVEVSVLDFMDDTKIITKKVSTAYAEDWNVPAFMLEGHTVWGATAMMLSEIKDLLKQLL